MMDTTGLIDDKTKRSFGIGLLLICLLALYLILGPYDKNSPAGFKSLKEQNTTCPNIPVSIPDKWLVVAYCQTKGYKTGTLGYCEGFDTVACYDPGGSPDCIRWEFNES